jgi:hypothetical protein
MSEETQDFQEEEDVNAEDSIRTLLENEFEDIETEEVPELAGDFFGDKEKNEEAKETPPAEDKEQPDSKTKPEAADKAPEGDDLKAPIGFSAEAREEWSSTPEKVKKQILKREQEIATTMQGTAEARRTHDTMGQLVNNYAQVLAAEGAETPMEAIGGIVQTVAQLRMGSPQQKAQVMANLVSHYGVDLTDLDGALASTITGEPVQPQEGGATPDIERIIDERMAPVNQLLNGVTEFQRQQQAAKQQGTRQTIEQFAADPANEFFQDVRQDMADIFDLATKRGQQIDIKAAYDKAVALNPELTSILAQRQTTQKVSQKRNASSAIRSVNTREPVKSSTGQDLRSDILDAWEAGMG